MITRTATAADVRRFYGRSSPWTLKAVVALENGEPVGLIGIAKQPAGWVFFSEFLPEIKARLHCMAALRAIAAGMALVRECKAPVVALAPANDAQAQSTLWRLGFRYVGLVDFTDGEQAGFLWPS